MQIAITSDIHNNEVNLEKVLRYCAEQKITTLICCGDLASKEVLDLINDTFVLGTPKKTDFAIYNVPPGTSLYTVIFTSIIQAKLMFTAAA